MKRKLFKIMTVITVSAVFLSNCNKISDDLISISLNRDTLNLTAGRSQDLTATVFPENYPNQKIAWTSSVPEVATVTSKGRVTAKSGGETVITATTHKGNKSATCRIIVPGGGNALPVVSTEKVAEITLNSATFRGIISNTGTPAYTERGFYYSSTNQNPTSSDSKRIVTGDGTGDFSANVTGLTANTTYYVRAFARNTVGTAYGSTESFITSTSQTSLPVLTTLSATNITATSAILGGNISNAGTPAYTERGICIATTSNPTTTNKRVIDGTGTGNYTIYVSGLKSRKSVSSVVVAMNIHCGQQQYSD